MGYQNEVSEALCAALYRLPFAEFMGEADVEGEHLAWFHLGAKPEDMRVTVVRPLRVEGITVRAEWRNYFADPRNPLKGEINFYINTAGVSNASDLHPATEHVLVRVLEVFRDVLAGDGVAGRISDLQEAQEEFEHDESN